MTQDKISAAVTQQTSLLDPFLLTQKPLLTSLAEHLVSTFHQEGRLFLVGSGPFGTIASLVSQTFLHRQTLERPALPAVALTNDAGLATFLASDEQGSQLFSRQLRALATSQDTVLVLAGTTLSQADREALNTAKQLGCRTILIASEQSEIADFLPNTSLALPSDSLPRLLESTLFIGNLLCTLVEGELFGI
jgi:D-sedoheptulose 7-phosphate isomerase